MRLSAAEDLEAGARRLRGEQQRAEQRDRRTARKAGDAKGIERVAVLRDELSLDAIRRPGERHLHPALAQGFGHRERREHVPGRSPRCDQTP